MAQIEHPECLPDYGGTRVSNGMHNIKPPIKIKVCDEGFTEIQRIFFRPTNINI